MLMRAPIDMNFVSISISFITSFLVDFVSPARWAGDFSYGTSP